MSTITIAIIFAAIGFIAGFLVKRNNKDLLDKEIDKLKSELEQFKANSKNVTK